MTGQPTAPRRRGDKCTACNLALRPLSSILRDVQNAPRAADVVVVAPTATVEEFDERLAEVVSGRLTRLQSEINGYCYACAFKLELLSHGGGGAEDAHHG
ncbi:hypothetical protein [Hyalangium versicolor]|uniref:hypothetical protein n=1 Tax=Hyalangium versicolor TaxID=2861190 RepID=UPI001CCFC283|nr:hypothetical protein [Hyalangium versicolor]